jgi:hypothetical protein
MNIEIFKELTTDEHLTREEVKSEEYIGLYVDMQIAEQRKYVKDKVYDIKELEKRIKAAAIAKIKASRDVIKEEEAHVLNRTAKIKEPFTLLIDDYNAERKLVLDAEKLRKAYVEAAINKESDHEYAILLDKSYLADKLAAEKAQEERDEAIRVDASNRATQAAKSAQEATDRAIAQDAANRAANKNNVRVVQRAIYTAFISAGLDKDAATKATQALIDSKIPHTIIHY